MRKMLSGLVAVLVLGLVVWAMLPRPVWVELADVAPRTIEVVVEEEGEARIREVFTVSATVGGKLQRIILHAGDLVVADETVVALIGPAEPALLDARARAVAEATVAAAEAAVDLARAMVTQAEATLVFMSSEADRARALLERSAVPQRTYDNAILQQITSQAAADSARANLFGRCKNADTASYRDCSTSFGVNGRVIARRSV